jgi:hypothetical protein
MGESGRRVTAGRHVRRSTCTPQGDFGNHQYPLLGAGRRKYCRICNVIVGKTDECKAVVTDELMQA